MSHGGKHSGQRDHQVQSLEVVSSCLRKSAEVCVVRDEGGREHTGDEI